MEFVLVSKGLAAKTREVSAEDMKNFKALTVGRCGGALCVNSYLQVSFYQGKAHRGESGADFLGRYGLNMAGLCLNTSIILCE